MKCEICGEPSGCGDYHETCQCDRPIRDEFPDEEKCKVCGKGLWKDGEGDQIFEECEEESN